MNIVNLIAAFDFISTNASTTAAMQKYLLIAAAVAAAAALLALLLSPRAMLKFIAWILSHTFLRVRIYGAENIPSSGPVLLVSNHVSILDLLMLQSICHNRVRFMARAELVDFLPSRFIFRYLGVIRVPNAKHPKEMQAFFDSVKIRLKRGETMCLFPEGEISGNGNLMRFRSGVEQLMPENVEVSVLPVRIGMLHGRMISFQGNRLHLNWPKKLPVNYSITVGEPVVPTLTPFQLRQKISELGAITERLPQPGELPCHTSFVLRAKRHPFRASFYDAATGAKMTNFKLLVGAMLLSRKILRLDRGENGYVGVLMPNCNAAAATLMAVLFADRTPAVINYSAGAQVALDSARRAGVKTIFTSRKFLEKLKWEPTLEMVFLEDVATIITRPQKFMAILSALFVPGKILVRNLMPMSCYNLHHQAVLLFSSGSTGVPKAVMITNRNINCDLWAFLRMIPLYSSDKFAGNLPLFHAFGFTLLFGLPAQIGMPVCYVLNPLNAAEIVKSIKDFKITLLTATPTFMQKYLHKITGDEFDSLRLIVTGGEKLRPELVEKFRAVTGKEITEGYGCTELSPIVTVNFSNSIYEMCTKTGKPGSIGCALPGIHVRIVDPETGVELGPDEPGRMQVCGGTVMKGYLNAPEQTARVIQNGYYDTGDVAKLDRDGYVYITGRSSRFSKIGGEMVPHEAIEDAITKMRNSEIAEVAVTGKNDPKRGEKLLVFYTPDDLDPAAVIEELRKTLPNLWVPKADDFIKVPELPLLGSGKLDMRKLNAMAAEMKD